MELHRILRTAFKHVYGKPFRKRVGNRRTYAVQTARDGIVFVIEFTARVQNCKYKFNRGDFLLRVNVHGDTSAVIRNADNVVGENLYINRITVAVENFVHTVVDDFPKDMVKSLDSRSADIHTGSFSYRIESLDDVNVFCAVILCHIYSLIMPCLRVRLSARVMLSLLFETTEQNSVALSYLSCFLLSLKLMFQRLVR